ncbi:hypothetical protein C8R44DRAFT_825766 [Mycena epipterygia]|nr:hypothetical protein C8R44DRAFT_825766 [Mycena epipterygia]
MVWAFWVQLYYQVYIGYSPVHTVVRLTPCSSRGSSATSSWRSSSGASRPFGCLVRSPAFPTSTQSNLINVPSTQPSTGTLTTTIAPLLFALIIPKAPYWAFGFPAAVCSIVSTRNSCSRRGRCSWRPAGPGEQSVAGGVFQTMTQLGTSFGVTASTIAPNHVQQGAMRNGADALASYHAAMWTGVAFGGLATLLVLVAFRGVGTIRKDNSHPTPALPLHPSDKDVGGEV